MSRVAVTGAAGFIGWHLARRLVAGGEKVSAIDLRPRPAGLESPNVSYHALDIRDGAALATALEGAETVYHLASAHLDVGASEDVYRAINVQASRDLVKTCASAGVKRLVHTGTVGIYGHIEHPPAHEDTAPAPGNMYERTKLEGEAAVQRAASEAAVELIILRPSWVYGPGCPRMAKLLRTVKRGRFLYIGAGTNLRHPVYVDDVVAAFLLAAAAPAHLSGRAYLIAGPTYMALKELVDVCAHAMDVRPPSRHLPPAVARPMGLAAELAWGALRRQPPFSRRSLTFFENDNAFDTTAARRDLGFEPTVELADGVRRTLDDTMWPVWT